MAFNLAAQFILGGQGVDAGQIELCLVVVKTKGLEQRLADGQDSPCPGLIPGVEIDRVGIQVTDVLAQFHVGSGDKFLLDSVLKIFACLLVAQWTAGLEIIADRFVQVAEGAFGEDGEIKGALGLFDGGLPDERQIAEHLDLGGVIERPGKQ